MQSFDLSRFAACSIRPVKLYELLRVREFRERVDAYHGDITDEWVLRTAQKVDSRLRPSPEYKEKLIQCYGREGYEKRRNKARRFHRIVKQIRQALESENCKGNGF